MTALAVTPEGKLSGSLPCGHDASALGVGWHYRIQCSKCWSEYVREHANDRRVTDPRKQVRVPELD